MSNDPWLTNTVSLESLQSENQRTILNLVDLLRQNNLDGIISLPQLVVCGGNPTIISYPAARGRRC